MTPEQLQQALAIDNGTVTISAAAFGNDPVIVNLLGTWFQGGPLVISQAQDLAGASPQQVFRQGTVAAFNCPSLTVAAGFTLDDSGNLSCLLQFLVVDQVGGVTGWTFGKSFADMPITYDFSTAPTDPQKSPLEMTELTLGYLVVSTEALEDPSATYPSSSFASTGLGASLSSGLGFVGNMRLTGLTGFFAAQLGGSATPLLHGTIDSPAVVSTLAPLPPGKYPWDLPQSPPGFLFEADLDLDVDLGPIHIGSTTSSKSAIHFYTLPSSAWVTQNPDYSPVVAYVCPVSIPTANIEAVLSSQALPGVSEVLLDADIEGLSLGNLSDLVGLTKTDIATLIPGDVKKELGKLSFEHLTVDLVEAAGVISVPYVYFTIGFSDIDWPIFPGHVEITSLGVRVIVTNPLSGDASQLAVTLFGTLELCEALSLTVQVQAPKFFVWAQLDEPVDVPLATLMKKYIPNVDPPTSNLSVDQAVVNVAPGDYYSIHLEIADSTPWDIQVGAHGLTIKDVTLDLIWSSSGGPPPTGTTGGFSGTIQIDQTVTFQVAYQIPGKFTIRGDLASVKLSQLLGKLVDTDLPIPSAFDPEFTNSVVLIQKNDSSFVFMFGTVLSGYAGLYFEAVEQNGSWGFVVGLDLAGGALSALPGLSALEAWSGFTFQEAVLVIASVAPTNFAFPPFAVFGDKNITNKTKQIKLPSQAGGLQSGFNFYAQMAVSSDKRTQLLGDWLKLDATIGITLQIGLDPATDSSLSFSVSGALYGEGKLTLTLAMTAALVGGVPEFQASASVTFVLFDGQAITVDIAGTFVPTGLFVSGTVTADPPINFWGVQLAFFAVELGIDWEGLPSFGIATSVATDRFASTLVLFLDMNEPGQSCFFGAVTDLYLDALVEEIANAEIPQELAGALHKVGVSGTDSFPLPASTATALDARSAAEVSAAFGDAKHPVPSDPRQLLIVVQKAGQSWTVTDMSTWTCYQLEAGSSDISVELEAQLYVVPQDTTVGSLRFNQGFHADGEIQFFGLDVVGNITVTANTGVAASLVMQKVSFLSDTFFSITSDDGSTGPTFRLSTTSDPSQPPPFDKPHLLVDGKVSLLGASAGIKLSITADGVVFDLNGELVPGTQFDVNGHFTGLEDFAASGSAGVGLNQALDLGPLGTVQIDTTLDGQVAASWDGKDAKATLDGSFTLQGENFPIVTVELDVTKEAFADLATECWDAVKAAVEDFLKSAENWLEWIGKGILTGVGDAEAIGKELISDWFALTAQEILALLVKLDESLDFIVGVLRGAEQTEEWIAEQLYALGTWTLQEIEDAIGSVFGGHADIDLHIDQITQGHIDETTEHIDQTSTPHNDQAGSPHIDETSGSHIDNTIPGVSHQDIDPPHQDQPGSPHIDTPAVHQDQAGSHLDTDTQHHDGPVHGDNASDDPEKS